jgi:hypothetical protein
MATIGTAVSAKTKVEFESAANIRGTTASRLAASLIEHFLQQEAGKDGPTDRLKLPSAAVASSGRTDAKTEQVHVRLEPFYFAELGRLANERHWYRGTYLGNLFRVHLDRRPVLCDVEINAVRQVARQLADMGRNINQVAKKLNTSLEHAHLVTSIDFELVRILIELETNAVKDLMKANVRGWGVSDVET